MGLLCTYRWSYAVVAAILCCRAIGEAQGAAQEPDTGAAKRIAFLGGIAPEGWRTTGPVEHYGVGDLYEKINGRSELYMAYDVAGLVFVSLEAAGSDDRVDLYLYDMKTPQGAFGVYSVERWPGSEEVDAGRMEYRAGADLIFWQGRYYVTLTAPEETEPVRQAQREIARTLEKRLPEIEGDLWGFDVLPEANREPESVQFFMTDALSLGFLTNTYTAEYDRGGTTLKVFVSRQEPSEAAAQVRAQFAEYLRNYGEAVEDVNMADSVITVANLGGGFYDAVFRRGRHVAGVTAVESKAAAVAQARWLARSLRIEE